MTLYRVHCACGWHSRWYSDGNLCWVYADRHEDRNAKPNGDLRYGHRINPNFEEKR